MTPFSSFWQAGFEGADHITRQGIPLSMTFTNGHQSKVEEDYFSLAELGITTVRESAGWRQCVTRSGYDFSGVERCMRAARKAGIQINWSICHYGFPAEALISDAVFIQRFAEFSGALARFLAPFYDDAPIYSPINEISFTSWALSVGFFPFSEAESLPEGMVIKRLLVRAAIAACDAIWLADPRARILHCDPVIHIVAPDDSLQEMARSESDAQYQAWDMLCGRLEPELGGAPRYLDLIGANYYHDNQWELLTHRRLWWHLGDPRREPLHRLLGTLYQRYQRPILLAETSHPGSGRGAWLNHITGEIAHALLQGTELLGICLYPAIDRHDWENSDLWHHSGIWDVAPFTTGLFTRTLNQPYADAILNARNFLQHFQEHQYRISRHSEERKMTPPLMIVFSHLRWDFVYQRPQHLLTLLAPHFRILYVEEPVYEQGPSGLHLSQPAPNITVARPHTEISSPGFSDEQIAEMRPLLGEYCADEDAPYVWFYTPLALPLMEAFEPGLIVFDCMDQLSAFKDAPRDLLNREKELFSRADIVFTGGPSLFAAKKSLHSNIHCFPSSVDAIHFEQALDRSNGHPLQQEMRHPRLGYYGVIDERMDLTLIAALATAHPEWEFIYVGPVVKIDPSSLPQASNIHYFGQQPYQALPQFLADWDLCLMPFALNESTQFISPTKVLEYMAAELPVVSTAIKDVDMLYGDLIFIATDTASFITGCEQALIMTGKEIRSMRQRMRDIVSRSSWLETAAQMKDLIDEAARKRLQHKPANYLSAEDNSVVNLFSAPEERPLSAKYLILGAGPTGLSAAYHLGEEAVTLERNDAVGGWCRSVNDKGFVFDYAGHIMFSADPYVLEMYTLLLGENLHWQNREAWVWSDGVYTRYPFQGALYGLPASVIKECLLGAIEARYGRTDLKAVRDLADKDCCADGTVSAAGDCTLTREDKECPDFESFIYRTWGAGIAKHFAIPYNKKIWKVPLNEMETSWLGGRVPLPDLAQIIEGALEPSAKPVGPNARFAYPLQGGFQALMSGFLPLLKGTLKTGAEIVRIHPAQRRVILSDGQRYQYESLISTLPLPELIKMMGTFAPQEIREAAAGLKFTSVRCVNLGIGRANITDKHWVYYPGDTLFHRVFMQGNASPFCNPENGFGLTCEMTYTEDSPLPLTGEALNQRCIEDCIRVGLFTADDEVLTASQTDIPCAYVIYDHQRQANVTKIRQWLTQYGITLSGRYSEWEYYNSDHAFLAGKKAAEALLSASTKTGTPY